MWTDALNGTLDSTNDTSNHKIAPSYTTLLIIEQ